MGYTRGYQSIGVGDPFIHSKIGGLLRGAGGLIGGPIGGIISGAGGLIGGKPTVVQGVGTTITTTVPAPTAFPGGFSGQPQSAPRGTTKGTGTQMVPLTGQKKRRRMNPLNVKALRRSTRRLAAFQREAKKVEKELRKLAPPARRRSQASIHHSK